MVNKLEREVTYHTVPESSLHLPGQPRLGFYTIMCLISYTYSLLIICRIIFQPNHEAVESRSCVSPIFPASKDSMEPDME